MGRVQVLVRNMLLYIAALHVGAAISEKAVTPPTKKSPSEERWMQVRLFGPDQLESITL